MGETAARQPAAWNLLLLGVWAGLTCIHLILPAELRLQVWPLSYMLLEALAVGCLAWRARRDKGPSRRAWWWLAASAFLEVPNLGVQALLAQDLPLGWAAGVSGSLSLGTGLLVLVGVLSFPRGMEGAAPLRRRILDSLIFAVALLFILLALGAWAGVEALAPGVFARVLVSYLNVALLGGGLVFMTSYDVERLGGPLGWLGASALAWLGCLGLWTLRGLPSQVAQEGWIVLAGGIPLFQALAARSPRQVEEVRGTRSGHPFSDLLPYAPVAVSVAAMALLLTLAPRQVSRGMTGLLLLLVALLLARQFQAIRDLQRGRSSLEDHVAQRTKALEQAQGALLRTERMNAIALMGAGLAHDLNNMLSVMKSSAELIRMNQEDGLPPDPKDLDRIMTSADSAAELTRRLMRFVRREEEASEPLELGPEILDMGPTLRLLLPRIVTLEVEVQPGPPLVVRTSRLRLEQMLVNLAANARDAMPDGGRLSITVDAVDGLARIAVADTGVGIPAGLIDRICDPFFTTKAPGKGTGLGLASVKAMAEEDGGRLEVQSEPGRGARFSVLLPLHGGEGLSPR